MCAYNIFIISSVHRELSGFVHILKLNMFNLQVLRPNMKYSGTGKTSIYKAAYFRDYWLYLDMMVMVVVELAVQLWFL